MGQAKIKRKATFRDDLIAEWETDHCVNFAVALARMTGWLLQVDWWTPSVDGDDESTSIEQFKPLRVYVADNGDNVFDVRGIRHFTAFAERTIYPLALPFGRGGVRTRFYGEEDLHAQPLRYKPDPEKIASATKAIQANTTYLANLPKRPISSIPAHLAARFAYGSCVPYAEALRKSTGLSAVAMLAVRMAPNCSLPGATDNGYFHSVVMHPDGSAEDSWGRATPKEIAQRFGVLDFELSDDEQSRAVTRLWSNTPDLWAARLAEAKDVIAQYRKS